MRPYITMRLIQGPDIQDIKEQARASHVGRLPSKSGEYKSYTRNPARRRAIRRYLKHRDNNRAMRIEGAN